MTRRGAVKARTQTINQLKALLLTGPAGLRERLRQMNTAALIEGCTRRVTGTLADQAQATKVALRRWPAGTST